MIYSEKTIIQLTQHTALQITGYNAKTGKLNDSIQLVFNLSPFLTTSFPGSFHIAPDITGRKDPAPGYEVAFLKTGIRLASFHSSSREPLPRDSSKRDRAI